VWGDIALEGPLARLLDAATDVLALVDSAGLLLYANAAATRMLGVELAEWRGRDVLELVHVEDQARAADALRRSDIARGPGDAVSLRLICHDGAVREVEILASPLVDTEPSATVLLIRDMTAQRQQETALAEAVARFEVVFDHAPIGMALLDLDGQWIRVNQALLDITGYSESELVERTFQDITHPEDLSADLAQVERLRTGEINSYQMEKRYYNKQGHVVWILLTATLLRDEHDAPLQFLALIQDISERKQAEDHLKWFAERDALTGLWNRYRFEQELERYQTLFDRYGEQSAVILADVDDFKAINDRFGHDIGDQVLADIGGVLKTRLRITDLSCRYGGDEFAILLPHTGEDEARILAAELTDAITKQASHPELNLDVRVSAGISAITPRTSATSTIAQADHAMYAHKVQTRRPEPR
jgi:diguanylate cyclase (GGDEF)-like protein/PAS domain S-box-containing protein